MNDILYYIVLDNNKINWNLLNVINKPKNFRPLKTPKGMRDLSPSQVEIRGNIIDKIKKYFKQHGAVTIDTPIVELTAVLQDSYCDGNKGIFNILKKIKRYHIGKVYRKDTPRMTKGRYREFYQCDFDIAGKYDTMLAETECLKL